MQSDKKHILNRLATIEGHLRGIRRMVEEDQYCVDIVAPTSVFGVLLSPVLAAAAMAMSSVSVVTNALRLRRFSRPENAARPQP